MIFSENRYTLRERGPSGPDHALGLEIARRRSSAVQVHGDQMARSLARRLRVTPIG
jgi:hypothetical protein